MFKITVRDCAEKKSVSYLTKYYYLAVNSMYSDTKGWSAGEIYEDNEITLAMSLTCELRRLCEISPDLISVIKDIVPTEKPKPLFLSKNINVGIDYGSRDFETIGYVLDIPFADWLSQIKQDARNHDKEYDLPGFESFLNEINSDGVGHGPDDNVK